MGLKGKPPTFISNFLFEREFKVRIISTYYDMHAQEMVVLQGSILSVTLFSIKIKVLQKLQMLPLKILFM